MSVSLDFPILGTEPLPVELANTLYGDGADRIDFLSRQEWTARWFAELPPGHAVGGTAAALGREAGRVRLLRNTVHHLLSAAADRREPAPEAITRLNGTAAAAPTWPELRWPPGGEPSASLRDTADGVAAVLGRIAARCVELLAGRSDDLRRCGGPGCSMLFVKNHSRRRWCHPSCGHRDRQARYYRRRHHSPESTR